ncbi:MAG: aminopeptidase [Bacilli bacterium]|nr:aminopeptidase [Bacilli bacterium]
MNYLEEISKKIVNYSLNVLPNERVLISMQNIKCKPIVKYLIKEIVNKKGIPFVKIYDDEIKSLLLKLTTNEKINEIKKQALEEVNNYDSFINIRYTTNDYEKNNVDINILNKISLACEKSDDIKINQRKWVLLNYPSTLDAYKAKKNSDEYYDYALKIMNFDYESMYEKIKPLKQLMEKTDIVKIIGPNTNISFSIKNMNVIPCCGKSNIPDGEIFTCPIKESVNGIITYNTESPYQGNTYKNVSLKFKDGKIIEAKSDDETQKLNQIFDTDEGARYIGEFSLGLNPLILYPVKDILFDEKIIGSIHFTPGSAYKEAYNGNESTVHWDLVLIQRKEYGGGEIYFDDKLIRKDGLFVLPELLHLNYDLK